MNAIATWIDQAFRAIADWLPDDPNLSGALVVLAILLPLLAWIVLPWWIARCKVPRRAGRPRRKLETEVADRWRSFLGRIFTVPAVVLTALYTLYQIGQLGQAAREAAQATFLEKHKNAFDALATTEQGHHIAAALALGQLARTNPELRGPILSALSSHAVAWSPISKDANPPDVRADARMALDVISLRPREPEIDCNDKQEGETTAWLARGNFRGMPFPVLRDERNKRQPVQLDRAHLFGSDLSGADLYCASLGYANLNFARLDGANLIEANFCGAHMLNAKLRAGENLASPGLQDGTKQPVLAYNANFRNADLRHAELVAAKLDGALLDEAHFDGADARRAVFHCARGVNVHFPHATLVGANFTKTQLTGADFRHAKLDGSVWDGANLEAATFDGSRGLAERLRKSGARLCKTKFGNLQLDDGCKDWPDPPEGCFTDTAEKRCSPYSLVRSNNGLVSIRELQPLADQR